VDEPEHHAIVMKYYKLGSVRAAFGTLAFVSINELRRMQLALQVWYVKHGRKGQSFNTSMEDRLL
jgi:hypothetical protein